MHIPARFVQNINTFPIFLCLFFWGGAGVYRDPEEAAAVMETAGAETLSVFPSEIPPGAVRLPAAEEVCGISGGEGCVLLGSEPWLGREEGWKSFSSEIAGAGWEGNTAGSVLVRVVIAFPSLCSKSPTLSSFPAAL